MIGKLSFVIAILFLSLFVVLLAALGWIQGYAWHQRKDFLGDA